MATTTITPRQPPLPQPYGTAGTDGFPAQAVGNNFGTSVPNTLPQQMPTPWSQQPYGTYQAAPYSYSPGYDAPSSPVYQTGWDPSMAIHPNLDMSAMNQFQKEAMRTGPSNWAGQATAQQGLEEKNARESGAKDVAGQTAQAQSALAMKGGLTSGASERLATQGGRDFLNMSQGIARQGTQNRLQIGVNDEQNRIEQLGMVPGMQAQATGIQMDANKFNVGQQTQEMQQKNQFNSSTYQNQMAGWAAGKTAQAQANSGGSCWIITGLARFMELPYGEDELLTRFKWYMLTHHKDEAKFYIRRCGKLVRNMDEQGFDWPSLKSFNDSLVMLMNAGDFQAAYSLFKAQLTLLINTYWRDCPHTKMVRKLFDDYIDKRLDAFQIKEPVVGKGEEKLTARCLQNLPQFQGA